MDISKIAPTERTIEIKHPATGLPVGIRVTVMSIDDDRMKAENRIVRDKNMFMKQRGKDIKSEHVDENETRLMVAAITGWDWYGKDAVFNGKKPDFTAANVREVLTTVEWFKTQIGDELNDTNSFFTS